MPKKNELTPHPTDEDRVEQMERLLSGGWFTYEFRTKHGTFKRGAQCQVKRGLNGTVLVRTAMRGPARIVYPINGKWYIEGLDPKRWNRRRHL